MGDIANCTEACEAMPDCAVCRKRKQPRGRDAGIYATSSYCSYDCPGYDQEPYAGHLWPGELRRWREEQEVDRG